MDIRVQLMGVCIMQVWLTSTVEPWLPAEDSGQIIETWLYYSQNTCSPSEYLQYPLDVC